MAVAKKSIRQPRVGYRETIAKQRAAMRKAAKGTRGGARAAAEEDEYNGMPLDEWKEALKKDVEERFGSIPNDLVATSEAGW